MLTLGAVSAAVLAVGGGLIAVLQPGLREARMSGRAATVPIGPGSRRLTRTTTCCAVARPNSAWRLAKPYGAWTQAKEAIATLPMKPLLTKVVSDHVMGGCGAAQGLAKRLGGRDVILA